MLIRRLAFAFLMAFAISTTVQSDEVVFSDFSVGGFEDIKHGGATSGSIVKDGVTFTLTLFSAGQDNPSVVNFSPDFQELTGVYKGSDFGTSRRDGRLDSDTIGSTFDDEAIRFSLAVSGAPLSALALAGLQTNLFNRAHTGENMDASDGTNTVNVLATATDRSLNYASDFTGLTPLTLGNVNTWELTVTARETASASEKSSFSFPSVTFRYTRAIPEPSSFGVMFGIGLACLTKRRRKPSR